METCNVKECHTFIYSLGYCRPHYRRFKKWGDPLKGPKLFTRGESNVGKICTECDKPAKKKGKCNKHYLQGRKEYQAAWYQSNRESRIKAAIDWQKNNPESRAATHVKRKIQLELSEEDRDISVEYRKAIAKDPCHYCGDVKAEGYHVDHYESLYNGGTDHWWNLVNACSTCNHRKNSMNGDDFKLRMLV